MSIPKETNKHHGHKSRQRSEQIDLSLALLAHGNTSGRRYSLQEIADNVGTSKACIQQIEMKAFKRLRHHLRYIYKEWKSD